MRIGKHMYVHTRYTLTRIHTYTHTHTNGKTHRVHVDTSVYAYPAARQRFLILFSGTPFPVCTRIFTFPPGTMQSDASHGSSQEDRGTISSRRNVRVTYPPIVQRLHTDRDGLFLSPGSFRIRASRCVPASSRSSLLS